MKVIESKIIPFKGYRCVNLFGILFVGKGCVMRANDYNHEAIHTEQMKELWYVPFYIMYLLEWLYRLAKGGNAYRNISFEREAYRNQDDMYYLKINRTRFAWTKYL